ncbi:hypothetical protein AB3S75_025352 [Citrus x aurantiifolia]
MVDYEWGNPSTIMLTGDEATQESNQSRQIFDHYTTQEPFSQHSTNTNNYFHQPITNTTLYHHHHQQQQPPPPPPHHHHHHHHNNNNNSNNAHTLFDPRAYTSASSYAPTHHSMLSIDAASGGYFMIPKTEEVSRPVDNFASRIGLNLGGRTYFSSADDDFVSRLYRRPRPGEAGSANIPRCQAEGCSADLTHAKHYHRRHKVCEFHSKASTVIAAGLTQRFCQQCSRFHLLSEFDNGKRSCRKRLADHNRRRRKSQQQPTTTTTTTLQDNQKSQLEPEILAKSPPDSGAHSSSSVTVAVSPPRMSLDCFRQKPSQATASTSAGSLFFSSG